MGMHGHGYLPAAGVNVEHCVDLEGYFTAGGLDIMFAAAVRLGTAARTAACVTCAEGRGDDS